MKARRAVWAAIATLGLLVSLASLGCSTDPKNAFVDNLRPTVRLTSAPVDTSEVSFYSVTLNWVGYDPDGRVDHFLYAIDPPSEAGSDTMWIKTEDNEKKLVFSASEPAWQDPLTQARDHHVFVIKAIDNLGLESASVFRAFFSYTTAPTVSILTPRPSSLLTWKLTPSVRFTWSGKDEDGVFTVEPVKYKYILLGPGSEITPAEAEMDPDGLRDFYAPHFFGWDSTSAETTETIITNLTPGSRYLFALVGFDEAGAYSPVFTLTNNMLRFVVTFAGASGPKITLFNESFFFTYASGVYSTDERQEINIEVPADQRITFNWSAQPAEGALMKSFRWALDIANVGDNTPREDPVRDTHLWSAPTLNITSATVGPFDGGEEHRFYVEAEDNVGLKSLGIVRFLVVRPSLTKEMVIIDDTRLTPDTRNAVTRCANKPSGAWPTAAELDTFLYAKGGQPWQCYPFNGQPTPSTFPGLFNGYEFDTVGTRYGAADMTTRLISLGDYRHVIWMVDALGATNNQSGTHPNAPITSLRYMTGPSRFNSLGAYSKLGGKLWMLGGGGAVASTISWNDPNNDAGGQVYSDGGPRPELVPGRFMYDLPKWRSEIRSRRSRAVPVRFTGRYGDSLNGIRPGFNTRSPKYVDLPPILSGKIPTSDDLDIYAPTRRFSEFYQTQFNYEFISKFNFVIEDVDPSPETVDEQSTLDTLYLVRGPGLPSPTVTAHNIVMTYYRGPDPSNREILFSGFNIWNYQYDQLREFVDYVLTRIWTLPPRNEAPAAIRPIVTQPNGEFRSRPPAGSVSAQPIGEVRRTAVSKGGARRSRN